MMMYHHVCVCFTGVDCFSSFVQVVLRVFGCSLFLSPPSSALVGTPLIRNECQ
jgi:hypothetical protein